MWPADVPPCTVDELSTLPAECRPFYVRAPGGCWMLDDVLGHIKSVQTPSALLPVYRIRQYSHRRAAFLRRELARPEDLALLPRYPATREAYELWPDADSLRKELLYDVPGRLHAEFRALWGG